MKNRTSESLVKARKVRRLRGGGSTVDDGAGQGSVGGVEFWQLGPYVWSEVLRDDELGKPDV